VEADDWVFTWTTDWTGKAALKVFSRRDTADYTFEEA